MPEPEPDHMISPFTGYTRAHWLAVADGLLSAAHAHWSPGCARILLDGPPSISGRDSDGLEGYARTFMLAAFRVAGEGGADPHNILAAYAEGLAAGTDPAHPEAWPRIDRLCRQTLVEACSIVLALDLTRPWLWDVLADSTRASTLAWLSGAFGLEIPDNNWHLFRVLVADFLEREGAPVDHDEVQRDLARVEEFHAGDGWFRDGAGDSFDHYCGWALQFYPALRLHLSGRAHPNADVVRERLHRFLEQSTLLVGADGSPVFQGRSLAYRFAAAAAPWAGALVDATPLSPGVTRRLASGMLRHFVEHGFLDSSGIPTLGWYGAFPPMTQSYSGPASPYWLAKAFAGLLLPADHPCWTEVEQPLPVERADQQTAWPAPGFLVSATTADGVVRLVNHGSDNHVPRGNTDDPLYSRLAYSTVTSPVLGDTDVTDNHVGLLDPERGLSVRGRIHRIGARGTQAASWHRPVWLGEADSSCRIETVCVVSGPWELRAHLVDAPAGLALQESGWQLAGDEPPVTIAADGRVRAERPDGMSSVLVSLHGHDAVETVRTTGTSAYADHGVTPRATATRLATRTVHVSLVGLGVLPEDWPSVSCQVRGTVVEATLPDGTEVVLTLGSP